MSTVIKNTSNVELENVKEHEAENSSPKNMTYERALSAFFEGQSPTKEQREQLPTEVDGLSVKRQLLIETILKEENRSEQLALLKELRISFGLSSDIRILYLSLTTEDETLALEALQLLLPWLEARGGDASEQMQDGLKSWRSALNRKVETLLLRSFNPKIQQFARQCSSLLF